MRSVVPIVYELSTATFPASEFGHCTKEEEQGMELKKEGKKGDVGQPSLALALH